MTAKDVYDKTVELWSEINDDADVVGHSGVTGPSSDPAELWNEDICYAKSAIHALKGCLDVLLEKERAKRRFRFTRPTLRPPKL